MTKKVQLYALIVVVVSIIIVILVSTLFTKEEDVTWERYYDFSGSEEGSFVLMDKDFIISTGYVDFNKSRDALLLCFTKDGEKVFGMKYGGPSDDLGKIVVSLEDGYLIVGSTTSYGRDGSMDAWLVKVDKDGNEIWNRSYGGDEYDEGNYVIAIDDGYIVVGSTESYGKNGSMDAWLVKVDKDGNEIWNRTYGGDRHDGFRSAASCGKDVVITGMTSSYGKEGNWDAWLVKVDKDGNEIWNRSYGGKLIDLFNDVIIDGDRIVAVGHSEQGEDKWYGFFVITSSDGDKILEKEVESKKSTGLSSIITLNGFYYAIGYEGMFGSRRDDLLLLKFDKNGNIVWKKLLGGKFEDAGIWLCGENDYLYLVGYKDRNGDSIYDFWILKFKIH